MNARRTILLIDDHHDLARRLGQASAERFPAAEYIHCTTGEQGLSLLGSGLKPEAILLDLNLPEISGFEVLERLRADADVRHVPVIIFTVVASDAARHACEKMGAAYYQVKPTSRTGYAAFATFLQTGLENGAFANSA